MAKKINEALRLAECGLPHLIITQKEDGNAFAQGYHLFKKFLKTE